MKNIFTLLICFFSLQSFAQKNTSFHVLENNDNYTLIDVNIGEIVKKEISISNSIAYKINLPNGNALLEKGAPDLDKISFSLQIPNTANTEFEIIDAAYYDITNIEIAPSKGKIYRHQNPNDFPYEKGSAYQNNSFYPNNLVSLFNPYILRDFRGQTVHIFPLQYNPISKTLRVYTNLKIKINYVGENFHNAILENDKQFLPSVFDGIYQNQFINFDFKNNQANKTTQNYTPLSQDGSMLVLLKANALNTMKPYIDWKNQKGIRVFVCNVDTISGGNNENTIYQTIKNYYNQHQILYTLIVGDNTEITPRNENWTDTFLLGPSDVGYGYISGNDHYPELIIGRFSGTNLDDIKTQVDRTLTYEKNQNTIGNWMRKQIAMGSEQGPGDKGQMDFEHLREIADSNINQYNYVDKNELYDGSHGGDDAAGDPIQQDFTNAFNNGVGLVNYCGHGSVVSFSTCGWGSPSDVNALSNYGKLPFIFSTACVNGYFINQDCLAENLLRARNSNGVAKGAIAVLMSTINQSWDPPMQGQDEMNAILRNARPNNLKNIYGCIAMNGCMSINDAYNTFIDPNGGNEITDTWTIFGDPSLVTYTKNEGTLSCTHASEIGNQETTFSVNCSQNDALIGLYFQEKFVASSRVVGGIATFTFPALIQLDSLFITATKQNFAPYFGYALVKNWPAGINDINYNNKLKLFPNPAFDILNLNITHEKIALIEIFDLKGALLLSKNNSNSILISSLADGNYFVKVKTEKGTSTSSFLKK